MTILFSLGPLLLYALYTWYEVRRWALRNQHQEAGSNEQKHKQKKQLGPCVFQQQELPLKNMYVLVLIFLHTSKFATAAQGAIIDRRHHDILFVRTRAVADAYDESKRMPLSLLLAIP